MSSEVQMGDTKNATITSQDTVRKPEDLTATLQSGTSPSWVTLATEGEMAPQAWCYTWKKVSSFTYPDPFPSAVCSFSVSEATGLQISYGASLG